MTSWTFLTYHARVLLCVAHDPGMRLRDIAASLNITERSAFGIITDLVKGRLPGQGEERPPQPLPHPGTPPAARTGRAGTHRRRDPGPPDRHRHWHRRHRDLKRSALRLPCRPMMRAAARAGQAGRLRCSICRRWTERAAPIGAADHRQGHPGAGLARRGICRGASSGPVAGRGPARLGLPASCSLAWRA